MQKRNDAIFDSSKLSEAALQEHLDRLLMRDDRQDISIS